MKVELWGVFTNDGRLWSVCERSLVFPSDKAAWKHLYETRIKNEALHDRLHFEDGCHVRRFIAQI